MTTPTLPETQNAVQAIAEDLWKVEAALKDLHAKMDAGRAMLDALHGVAKGTIKPSGPGPIKP